MIRLVIPFFLVVSLSARAADHHEEHAELKVETKAETKHEEKKEPMEKAKHIDLPAGCFAKKFPCALSFTSTGKVELNGVEVSVLTGTSIVLREKEMELLSGTLWSDSFEDHQLRHGILSVSLTGDVLVEKDEDQITITNLNGVAEVKGGRKTPEPIPSGFQNWYRGLGQKGEFVQGVLEPARPEEFLSTWVTLSGLSLQESQERAAIYAANRKQAVGESAKLYQDILQMRRLASEEQDRLNAMASAKREQERSHFKQMMRNRLFKPD